MFMQDYHLVELAVIFGVKMPPKIGFDLSIDGLIHEYIWYFFKYQYLPYMLALQAHPQISRPHIFNQNTMKNVGQFIWLIFHGILSKNLRIGFCVD